MSRVDAGLRIDIISWFLLQSLTKIHVPFDRSFYGASTAA